MTEVLIGGINVTGVGLYNYGVHYINRAICIKTGVVKSLYYYAGRSGNGKINIYDGNADIGINLLWANNTSQYLASGQWHSFNTTDIYVIKNNYYWIGMISENPVRWITYHNEFTGAVRGKIYNYSSYAAVNPLADGYSTAVSDPICCYAMGDPLLYSNPLLLCTI